MSDPPRSVLVIANPVSGQRDFGATRAALEAGLEAAGVAYRIRVTEGEGDAKRWAAEAGDDERVVVSGGDGTVMEALSGLVGREVALAQIPAGTANLLAQALGIPNDLEAALEIALGGRETPFDVGYLSERDRYFAMVAGAGWDAQLIGDASRDLKDRLGFLAYVVTGVRNLLDLQLSAVTLEVDGETHRVRAHTVMVVNVGDLPTRRFRLGDHISPHDGSLDVALIAPDSVWGMTRIALRLLRGRFESDEDLSYLTVRKRLRVEAEPPLEVQIDGEAVGTTPMTIEVIPDGVKLVVPDDYRASGPADAPSDGSAAG